MDRRPLRFQDIFKLRRKAGENDALIFETLSLPPKLIPNSSIAYGGYTTAVALQAAFQSLVGDEKQRDQWSIYSVTGLFLGPAMNETTLELQVDVIRETRSFATRFITASQVINGKKRKCVCMTADFIQKMPSSPPHRESRLPLSYSVSSYNKYPHPDQLKFFIEEVDEKVKRGEIPQSLQKVYHAGWGKTLQYSDFKLIKGNILYETMMGLVPLSKSGIKTDDQKKTSHVTQHRSAEYFRAREPLDSFVPTDQDDCLPISARSIQACMFLMIADGPIPDFPVLVHGLGRLDAGALSSLDFAVRFHDDDYNFNQWHLREIRTYCADRQRTFGEALFFNLNGKLIASSTQQCTCWPKKEMPRL